MKLIRLKITDPKGFRSLQAGFELNFLREWNEEDASDFNPYILAGPNGSGKSNLLEALALIFYHIECMHLNYRPPEFEYDEELNPKGFQGSVSIPNAFELEYFIEHPYRKSQRAAGSDSPEANALCHIQIIKKVNESPTFQFKNWQEFPTAKDEIIEGRNVKFFLPANVVAYSSGENEVLSLPFYKMRFIQFDEYRNILIKDDFYGQVPEGHLVYVDEHFNQSILLANLLMQDDHVLEIFKETLQLTGIKRFSIIIGKHHFEKFDEEILANLKKDQLNKQHDTEIELTTKLETTIDKLKKCATSHYYFQDEESESSKLVLDYYVNEQTKKAFKFHFEENPLVLFQAFQILYTLNYCNITENNRQRIYTSPNIFLKQDLTQITLDDRSIFRIKELQLNKGNTKNIVYTRSLSDGEHQLLHSIGLCLLYRNAKTLFLLDEPETHFNPDWRSRFISILRNCFDKTMTENTINEMLITTHTPFLISDSKKEYVLVFKKNPDDETIEVKRPDYNTLGASINQITMKTFDKTETISGYAEKQLNEIKKRFKAGESKQELIDEVNNLLGDSVEKLLFMNQVRDSMEIE